MVQKQAPENQVSIDSSVSVRDAAYLTNMSVPAFYTERNKKLLGFHDRGESSNVWLIPVRRLVEVGFLTPDLKPVKIGKRLEGSSELLSASGIERQNLSELTQRLEALEREVDSLKRERDNLRLIADERAKQLEMINTLITNMGIRADEERG